MTISKLDFSTALNRITSALDNISSDDFSKLLDDSYRIEIKLIRIRQKDELPDADKIPIDELVNKLTAFSTREDAQSFLSESFSTKKILETIARGLDIPISKQDKIESIRDKIIEATVGARLRSQAIQGNPQI